MITQKIQIYWIEGLDILTWASGCPFVNCNYTFVSAVSCFNSVNKSDKDIVNVSYI